jgi:hypothetical protein
VTPFGGRLKQKIFSLILLCFCFFGNLSYGSDKISDWLLKEDKKGFYEDRNEVKDLSKILIGVDLPSSYDYLLYKGWRPVAGKWHKHGVYLYLNTSNGKVTSVNIE